MYFFPYKNTLNNLYRNVRIFKNWMYQSLSYSRERYLMKFKTYYYFKKGYEVTIVVTNILWKVKDKLIFLVNVKAVAPLWWEKVIAQLRRPRFESRMHHRVSVIGKYVTCDFNLYVTWMFYSKIPPSKRRGLQSLKNI